MRSGGFVVLASLTACGQLIPAPSDDAGAADAAVTDAADSDGGPADGSSAVDANADAGCPAETCANRSGCTSLDFETDCGPWVLGGNLASTVHECSTGKLHLAGTNTDDVTATATVQTPTTTYKVRVAARMALADWDSGRVLRVQVNGSTVVQLRGDDLGGGTMQLSLCRATVDDCAAQKVAFPAETEHLVVLDISPTVVQMTVDCLPAGEVPPAASLTTNDDLTIQLGKPDAQPIDATFDDVLVWFVTS